ncbi:MAG: hypothetical protein WEK74_09315 [Hydrogenophaga sp.]
MPDPQVSTSTVFAKTPLGQQEMQSRALGLAPLVRRVLVLIDGKRSHSDLAALVPSGSDVGAMIEALLANGCVQPTQTTGSKSETAAEAPAPESLAQPAPAPAPATAPGSSTPVRAIQGLPPAGSRSVKDNEMARHFMINSVNAIIGQQMRISLIHDIFHSDTTEKLREVYFAWEDSMANHTMGARRLPELRGKLFKVL